MGYTGEPDKKLSIPATIDGLPVREIAPYAFADCSSLWGSLTIP